MCVMLLYLALLLVASLVARALQTRWLAPAPMFGAYWAVCAALPVMLLSSVYVTETALAYVLVAVIVFTIGGAIAMAVPSRTSRDEKVVPPELHRAGFLRGFLVIGTLDVATFGGLLDTGNALSVARYAGDEGSHPLVPLLLAFAYTACMIAPFTFLGDTRRPWRKLAAAAPLLSVVLYSAVTTARLGMLIGGVLAVSGYIAMRLLRDGEVPCLSGRFLFSAALSACALAASFVAIAFVRVGRIDSAVIPVIAEKLNIYAFGYLPAFSQWLEIRRTEPSPLGWGTSSLAGAEFVTGIDRDSTRAYEDRVLIDEWGATTNIYTGFRNLLLDFSEPGALVLLAVFGFLLSSAYLAAKIDAKPVPAAFMVCGYSIILLSNTMLITTFTNVVAAMLLGIWAVWLGFKPKSAPSGIRRSLQSAGHTN